MRDKAARLQIEVGARIKQLRGDRSQNQFAALLEVDQSHLSQIERGQQLARADLLLKIATANGVSVDWLLTGKDRGVEPSTSVVNLQRRATDRGPMGAAVQTLSRIFAAVDGNDARAGQLVALLGNVEQLVVNGAAAQRARAKKKRAG